MKAELLHLEAVDLCQHGTELLLELLEVFRGEGRPT